MTIEEYNQSLDLYSDGLKRFVERLTMNNSRAEDIVQDTYENLWIKLDKIQNSNLKSYLFHSAYQFFLKDKMRDSLIYKENIDSESDYNHTPAYTDIKDILHQAIDTLTPVQKTAIILKEYEGFEYEEIGEMMEETTLQVKQHVFRARVALQKYLVKSDNVI